MNFLNNHKSQSIVIMPWDLFVTVILKQHLLIVIANIVKSRHFCVLLPVILIRFVI